MRDFDIIRQAIKMEEASRDYYRQMRRGPLGEYAGETLNQLAREEQWHRDMLAEYSGSLAEGSKLAPPEEGRFDEPWKRFMTALDRMRADLSPGSDAGAVVQRAIEMEKEGMAVYRDARNTSESEAGKLIFDFLARQEVVHQRWLEKLLTKLT